MPTPRETEATTQTMTIRMPVALHERLKYLSIEERRPVNAIVLEAVEGYLGTKKPRKRVARN